MSDAKTLQVFLKNCTVIYYYRSLDQNLRRENLGDLFTTLREVLLKVQDP